MEVMLFSGRSILTMLHGVLLGSVALLAMAAALFALRTSPAGAAGDPAMERQSKYLALLLTFIAVTLWITVFAGTYLIFPVYRATPPQGVTDLSMYPRSLIQSNPSTVWLHAFGMEIKEHVPWIASMLATATAFVGTRYRHTLVSDPQLRGMTFTFLAITFVLVSFAGLLGTFINKVAPLQ